MSFFDFNQMRVERVEIKKNEFGSDNFRYVVAELTIKDQFGSQFKAKVGCWKNGKKEGVRPLRIVPPLTCSDEDYNRQNKAWIYYGKDEMKIQEALISNGFEFAPDFLVNWKPN